MKYHVIFSCPEASIWEGEGDDPRYTFESFESAKAAAIDDLEHWLVKLEGNLDELRSAKKIADLSYHQAPK